MGNIAYQEDGAFFFVPVVIKGVLSFINVSMDSVRKILE
jgi:hypothetical protein